MTDLDARANVTVWSFTAAAAATGAIPVPGASVAIVAENAALVAAVASVYGARVTVAEVAASLGTMGVLNATGRAVFVDCAKLLGWFAGPLGVPGIMVLGATTAAVQTWVVGQLAIAICRNGGPLAADQAQRVVAAAHASMPTVEELLRSRGRVPR